MRSVMVILVLIVVPVSFLAPVDSAAGCIDYGEHLHSMSAVPPRSSPYGIPFDVGAAREWILLRLEPANRRQEVPDR